MHDRCSGRVAAAQIILLGDPNRPCHHAPSIRADRRMRDQPWLPGVNCSLRSADCRGRGRAAGECSGRGARLAGGRCARQEAGGGLCAVRAGPPGFRRRHRRCVRPRIPGFSPGGLGPHLSSSGSPRGLSSGFPFARRVLPLRPPSPGFPSSGVLRFVAFGRCPVPVPLSGVPAGFPSLGNRHDSAAAGRFRRRWSRAARTKVTSPAAATPAPGSRRDLVRTTPDGQRRARPDAAAESPVARDRGRRTPPHPNHPERRLARSTVVRRGHGP